MLFALRDFLALLYDRFVATRCPQVAGSLTYTTLLAIVPLVTVTIALFSNFPAFSDLGEALSVFLQTNILPDRAGQIVATYALQFSEKAAQLTLIGTVMLVVTVLLLLHTIDSVFNDIWGVRTPRPWLTRLTVYWVALSLGPIALAGSVFATGRLVATSIEWIAKGVDVSAISSWIVPLGLLGALFSFLYYAVPNHPVRLVHALIGGFTAALGFILMQRLFGLFIARFPTYTLVYGTFAALPIFLVWLYMSWVVVLLGAILAATFPSFFERKLTLGANPGDKAWAALDMLAALTRARRAGGSADFETLRAHAGVSQDVAESILGEMRDIGWVARTDEHGWVLAKNADLLTLAHVIDQFALSPGRWLAANGGEYAHPAARRLDEGIRAANLTITELANAADTPQSSDETAAPAAIVPLPERQR
ncbi:MAG: YihY family inner membrane protein [Rhodocyclaceae bacterium]